MNNINIDRTLWHKAKVASINIEQMKRMINREFAILINKDPGITYSDSDAKVVDLVKVIKDALELQRVGISVIIRFNHLEVQSQLKDLVYTHRFSIEKAIVRLARGIRTIQVTSKAGFNHDTYKVTDGGVKHIYHCTEDMHVVNKRIDANTMKQKVLSQLKIKPCMVFNELFDVMTRPIAKAK